MKSSYRCRPKAAFCGLRAQLGIASKLTFFRRGIVSRVILGGVIRHMLHAADLPLFMGTNLRKK